MRSRCCAPKTSSEKPFISLSIHAHADFFGRRLQRGAPLVVPLRLFHAGNDVAVFLSFPLLGSVELPVGPALCCLPKGCTPNVEPHWGWDCCCSQVVLSIRGMTMMVAVQLQCNGQSRQLRDGMDIPARACLHVPGEQLRVLGGVCTPTPPGQTLSLSSELAKEPETPAQLCSKREPFHKHAEICLASAPIMTQQLITACDISL